MYPQEPHGDHQSQQHRQQQQWNQQPTSKAGYAPGAYVDPRAQLNTGVERFMTGVFGWMGLGMLVTASIIFALTLVQGWWMPLVFSPETGWTGLGWAVAFAPFLLVMFVSPRMLTMSPTAAKVTFLAYAALIGLELAYLPYVFNLPSLAGAFVATTLMYGALAAWGYFTKKDLSGWGSFLLMALFGLFFAMMASFIFGFGSTLFSVLFVLLFAGMTAYKTQWLKQMYLTQGAGGNLAVFGALALYITFINMFVFILHIFGGRR